MRPGTQLNRAFYGPRGYALHPRAAIQGASSRLAYRLSRWPRRDTVYVRPLCCGREDCPNMFHTKVGTHHDVTVIALSEADVATIMDTIHGHALDVIQFYSEQLGFYPHKYLVLVPGEDRPTGGFPLDKGIVAIHHLKEPAAKEPDYWRWITAHEIAHMYWGYHVLESEVKLAQLGWLTIGLGLYLDKWYVDERRIAERFHDEIVRSYLDLREPPERTSFNIDLHTANGFDFDYNTVILHGKSYHLVQRLEQTIGREQFRRIYRSMVRAFAGRKISWSSLLEFVSAESGVQLSDARGMPLDPEFQPSAGASCHGP